MCGNVREQKRPLTTRQNGRLVSNWVGGIGPDKRKFATHSMRRTIGVTRAPKPRCRSGAGRFSVHPQIIWAFESRLA